MNYLKVYCKLVRKFEERNLTRNEGKELFGYCEVHHIWMRSIYGQEKDGNTRTTFVSAREHYILHAVLEKAYIKRYGLYHPYTKKATLAFTRMKNGSRYYNSRLFETAYKRKVSQQCIPIRIYFEDGRILDWYTGINDFCSQNNQYTTSGITYLKKGKYNRHKDILKIEEIDRNNPPPIKPLVYQPNILTTIPIRIYFEDGRIIEWNKSMIQFSRENPEYNPRMIGSVLNKRKKRHRDIIKIEFINKEDEQKRKWKTNKISIEIFLPIKIIFDDGRIIDCREGMSYFCRENNHNYCSTSLLALLRGKMKKHKDIVKVVKISNMVEFPPSRMSPNTKELIKINPSKLDYTRGDY
jgi:hypothetical protein